MNQILIAATGGGLGNRLNTIFTAISLHIHTGLPLSILWSATADFQCEFYDLFEEHPLVSTETRYPFFPFVPQVESIGEYVLVARYFETHPKPFTDVITSEDINQQLAKIETYKLKYHFAVHGPEMFSFGLSEQTIGKRFFELFRPKETILREVKAFILSKQPINGIHMRLTDKVQINKYSYSSIQRDLTSLQLNTNLPTFICSDDNNYELDALSCIPNSVNIPKDSNVSFLDPSNNNSIFRAKDTCVPAFIDLLIFTYCRHKYGINSSEGTSTFFSCARFLHESFIPFIET